MTVHRMARVSGKKKVAGAKCMRQRYTNIVAPGRKEGVLNPSQLEKRERENTDGGKRREQIGLEWSFCAWRERY
jgi:hypothetical protein